MGTAVQQVQKQFIWLWEKCNFINNYEWALIYKIFTLKYGWFDSVVIIIRKVDGFVKVINDCIFDVNKGGLSDGQIILIIGTDDKKVGYETRLLALTKESLWGLMDSRWVKCFFKKSENLWDIHDKQTNS